MRTTIEIKDEHRARLLELAARRGEKGFSELIGEAIEAYLATRARRQEALRTALSLRGSLSDKEADSLRESAQEIRQSWR